METTYGALKIHNTLEALGAYYTEYRWVTHDTTWSRVSISGGAYYGYHTKGLDYAALRSVGIMKTASFSVTPEDRKSCNMGILCKAPIYSSPYQYVSPVIEGVLEATSSNASVSVNTHDDIEGTVSLPACSDDQYMVPCNSGHHIHPII